MYAKDIDMLGGNKNGYYFVNNKENKFTLINAKQEFANDRNLYKIMYSHIIPSLEKKLSTIKTPFHFFNKKISKLKNC
jgi:hypothetical protein